MEATSSGTELARALRAGSELPRSEWSLGDAELELVLGEVASGRRSVVECGSGASTLLIARVLREQGGGAVHALEHDHQHAALARARIAAERLGEFAHLIEAPLADDPLAQPGCRWYARSALAELADEIDLLLVDGPPASPEAGLGRARYPALPRLADRLARGALVLLDDADRDGERWVLERWGKEFGLRFETRDRLARAVWHSS